MFKIYFNNRLLVLSDNWDACLEDPNSIIYKVTKKSETVELVNYFLSSARARVLCLVSENPSALFDEIKELFECLDAAGGFVRNKAGEVLLIFRNGRWDLPKGRCEMNETIEEAALREVEEECGVQQLQLHQPALAVTYHIYNETGRNILKRTYWFRMDYFGTTKPTPQTIEGITRAEFMPVDELSAVFSSAYASVLEVFHEAGFKDFKKNR